MNLCELVVLIHNRLKSVDVVSLERLIDGRHEKPRQKITQSQRIEKTGFEILLFRRCSVLNQGQRGLLVFDSNASGFRDQTENLFVDAVMQKLAQSVITMSCNLLFMTFFALAF